GCWTSKPPAPRPKNDATPSAATPMSSPTSSITSLHPGNRSCASSVCSYHRRAAAMFDSIINTGEFLSDHWLAEVFSSKLRDLTRTWRDEAEHGKHTPWHGLQSASGPYLKAKAELPEPGDDGYEHALT